VLVAVLTGGEDAAKIGVEDFTALQGEKHGLESAAIVTGEQG